VSGLVLVLLLASMLTLAFDIQTAMTEPPITASQEPPATEWTQTYGGTGNDVAWAVVQTSDGGYAIAGYTNSYGAGTRTTSNFWLVRTNSTGNMLWSRIYGGASADYAYSVVQTGDGEYALAGYTDSYGADGDSWLVKTDSTGNMLWNKTYGGAVWDYAQSVVQTGDGGYALAGYTTSYGSGWQFFLVKTDFAGAMQWNKTYGGTDTEAAYSLVQTGDGGYALAGYTLSYGAGNYDFWLVKLSKPLKFGIGDWVQTTANLNVREGPGLNYSIVSIMPLGAIGQILGGPVEADGFVWWDVDYALGVRGWSADNWLETTSELSGCGIPVLISPLRITRTVDTLTAEFIVQNLGDSSITLDRLLVGGRFNGGTLSTGDYPDFPYESVTLARDESYEYDGTMQLSEVGNYQFFVAYYIETPSEQERRLLDSNNWNTCIDLAGDLTDKDRSLSFEKWPAVVISAPLLLTPSRGHYYPGSLIVGRFSIKNVGSVPVTLNTLTVGGRDPDGLTVDLDWRLGVTIQPAGEPDDEYTYIGLGRLPGKIGNYHFFCAYQAADGSWNPCIDLGEGLTDSDRVKDIYVESEYPLGGILIPEADFPEGNGNVIPIYIPDVVDGSNAIREDDNWETVQTLVKTDSSWDWEAFLAGLGASGAEVWDPMQNKYVPSPEGSALSLLSGVLRAASGAQTVIQIGITIQRDFQWNYRAIVQVSDPGAKSLYDIYAMSGMRTIVPGELPIDMEVAISDGIADYFNLPAAKFSEKYLKTWYIDRAHINEEYNCYLSLSKGNKIELTPKIYQGDALGFNLWKKHLIFFWVNHQEVVRLEGQAYVDFEKVRANDAQSKLIQKALAQITLVPETAILLNGGSPCEFRVWDSQGRVTGLVSGEMREEIPGSIYLSETKTIIVYDPAEGLRYEVLGTDTGSFELNITLVKDWNATAFTALSIPITNQSTHQYTVDWDALSVGEEGATVFLDADGDGIVDRVFSSDSELTGEEFTEETSPTYPTHALTLNAGENGTTFPSLGTYACSANSTVQVTAIPDEGYVLDYWELDSVNVGSNNPYTVLMQENHTLNAVFRLGTYNVAVTNVLPSKTLVGEDCSLNTEITVANLGDFTETFNMTLYANATAIETIEIILASESSTTITFPWGTTRFALGNYTLWAHAEPVPGETSIGDNTFVYGWVVVTIQGDVNGDRLVDAADLVDLNKAYGSTLGSPTWNANCDINGDNKVDALDLFLHGKNYGKTDT